MKIFNIFKRKEYILDLVIIFTNLYAINAYFDYSAFEIAKRIYKISVATIILHYLICVFLESEFDSIFFKILQIKIEKNISYISFIIVPVLPLIMSCANSFYSEYLYYKQFCPYSLSEIDYKLHFKRRCELYNIDKGNIYPYQYICSYNEQKIDIVSEGLSKQFFLGNYSDVKCSKIKKLIDNNKIIDEFVNEYYKEELYYCNLKVQIKKFPKSINPKNCNDQIFPNNVFVSLQVFPIMIFIYWLFSYFRNIRANVEVQPDYTHLKYY